jgi:ferritin-like metal-binding protein YciE
MTPQNLRDLYKHQLRDLYSAESPLIDALPDMIDEATSPALKQAFRTHLEETIQQKERLTRSSRAWMNAPGARPARG